MTKNKFWECAERLGANLNKKDVDQCFRLFDTQGKGYFSFIDFTRVSKLVQGFEIDQIFKNDNKGHVVRGKRCQGFKEKQDEDYTCQKLLSRQAFQLQNEKIKAKRR